jgi:hypothetical protein
MLSKLIRAACGCALVLVCSLSTEATVIRIVTSSTSSTQIAAYTTFLEGIYGPGVVASVSNGRYTETALNDAVTGAARRQELMDADLVIVMRETSSDQYDGTRDFWNTTLTTPVLLHNAYLVRGTTDSRWNWLEGNQAAGGETWTLDPGHPFAAGLTLTGPSSNQLLVFGSTSGALNLSTDTASTNGAVVGQDSASRIGLAVWQAGDVFDGTNGANGDTAGGMRVFFAMREGNGIPALSDGGKALLTNVLTSLVPVPEPSTFVLAALAAAGLFVIRRRAGGR